MANRRDGSGVPPHHPGFRIRHSSFCHSASIPRPASIRARRSPPRRGGSFSAPAGRTTLAAEDGTHRRRWRVASLGLAADGDRPFAASSRLRGGGGGSASFASIHVRLLAAPPRKVSFSRMSPTNEQCRPDPAFDKAGRRDPAGGGVRLWMPRAALLRPHGHLVDLLASRNSASQGPRYPTAAHRSTLSND